MLIDFFPFSRPSGLSMEIARDTTATDRIGVVLIVSLLYPFGTRYLCILPRGDALLGVKRSSSGGLARVVMTARVLRVFALATIEDARKEIGARRGVLLVVTVNGRRSVILTRVDGLAVIVPVILLGAALLIVFVEELGEL
jgi:hypothetical protein